MNFFKKFHLGLFVLFLALSNTILAQSPTDELMMPAKEICFLLYADYGQFDQYWEGDFLRSNATIATVQRRSAMLMAAYGLLPKLNVYATLPYIQTNSTRPNGGKFEGTSGLQDISIGLKYELFQKYTEKGKFSGYGSLNFSTPISNYTADYQPYSLGLGTPQLAWRAILQYQWKSGFYLRSVSGYLWKGYTQSDREYYYNNGSYYTQWMDVPSSFNQEVVIGKWFKANVLRVELSLASQRSFSGDDIRPYNAPQPTNKVNYDRVGFFAHYYSPKLKGFGVQTFVQTAVNGENSPKQTSIGLGFTYQFKLIP